MDVKTKTTYVVTKPFELDGKKLKVSDKVKLNYLEAGYLLTSGFLMPEHLMAAEPVTQAQAQAEPEQASA
jgi:hypothetical protein